MAYSLQFLDFAQVKDWLEHIPWSCLVVHLTMLPYQQVLHHPRLSYLKLKHVPKGLIDDFLLNFSNYPIYHIDWKTILCWLTTLHCPKDVENYLFIIYFHNKFSSRHIYQSSSSCKERTTQDKWYIYFFLHVKHNKICWKDELIHLYQNVFVLFFKENGWSISQLQFHGCRLHFS